MKGSKWCLTARLLLLGHQKQSQQKQGNERTEPQPQSCAYKQFPCYVSRYIVLCKIHLAFSNTRKKNQELLNGNLFKKNKKIKCTIDGSSSFSTRSLLARKKENLCCQQLHPGRVMDILENASLEAKGSSYFVTVVRSSRSRKQPLHRPLHLRPRHNTAATWVNTCLFQRHAP